MYEAHVGSRRQPSGVHYSKSLKRELRKYSDSYDTLTPVDKLIVATKVGIPLSNFRKWMQKELRKQKRMKQDRAKFQGLCKKEETINSTGIY